MEGRPSNEISSAEAVLVGALSSGVNEYFILSSTLLLRVAALQLSHSHNIYLQHAPEEAREGIGHAVMQESAPTWFMLQITFLLLAFCFTAMLALAFSSKNFVIVGHVLLLVAIGTVLFVLLNRFLAEVGLVPVEQQMQEIGINKTEAIDKDKRS